MGANRLVQQVDSNTGEILEGGCLVYVPQRQRFREAFVMLWQDALKRLAEEGKLSARHWRVLVWLMGRLDYENYIHVTQADIARELRMDPSDVSKIIRDLLQRGVMVKGPRVGRSFTFRMSGDLGWKGQVRSFQEERKRRLALVHTRTPSTGGKPSQRR